MVRDSWVHITNFAVLPERVIPGLLSFSKIPFKISCKISRQAVRAGQTAGETVTLKIDFREMMQETLADSWKKSYNGNITVVSAVRHHKLQVTDSRRQSGREEKA